MFILLRLWSPVTASCALIARYSLWATIENNINILCFLLSSILFYCLNNVFDFASRWVKGMLLITTHQQSQKQLCWSIWSICKQLGWSICKEGGLMVTPEATNPTLPCLDEKPCSNPYDECMLEFSDSFPSPAFVKCWHWTIRAINKHLRMYREKINEASPLLLMETPPRTIDSSNSSPNIWTLILNDYIPSFKASNQIQYIGNIFQCFLGCWFFFQF